MSYRPDIRRGWCLSALLWLLLLCVVPAARATITVTDSLNRTVEIAAPARRVVTLAPHLVENLYSAGGGPHIVGTVSFSNFPPEASELPLVGSFNAFSLESIVALKPDLIVMWGSGNGPQALERLSTVGIPIYVDELRDLQELYRSIENLGTLTGATATAGAEALRLERTIEQLRKSRTDVQRLGVFYQIWHEPLQTLGGDHMINEIIDLCGGRNIYSDTKVLAPRVSIESILDRDPDVIVASGMSRERPAWLEQWRAYPALKAVRNDTLYSVDPDLILRPTARLVKGAQTLCQHLDDARNRSQITGK